MTFEKHHLVENIIDLDIKNKDEIYNYIGKPFNGVLEYSDFKFYGKETYVNGIHHGIFYIKSIKDKFGCIEKRIEIYFYGEVRFVFQFNSTNDTEYNIYSLGYDDIELIRLRCEKGEAINIKNNYIYNRQELDYDKLVAENRSFIDSYLELQYELYSLQTILRLSDYAKDTKVMNAYLVQQDMKKYLGKTVPDTFMEKFVWQEEQIPFISQEDNLSSEIRYLGGVSVGFNDISQKAVATITVFDIEKQEIVDVVTHSEEDVTMHIPDLFAFNEVKWVLKVYDKLTIKPQLLFCDGHGLEHPRNMGLATFLGIQLNLPTIGVAKKRLVGYYDKETLGKEKGDNTTLLYDSKVVGKALRTQVSENPVYISTGNKISLETSIEWVKKMTVDSRVPFVLENAIQKTRELLPEQFRIDFLNDEPNNNGIII